MVLFWKDPPHGSVSLHKTSAVFTHHAPYLPCFSHLPYQFYKVTIHLCCVYSLLCCLCSHSCQSTLNSNAWKLQCHVRLKLKVMSSQSLHLLRILGFLGLQCSEKFFLKPKGGSGKSCSNHYVSSLSTPLIMWLFIVWPVCLLLI